MGTNNNVPWLDHQEMVKKMARELSEGKVMATQLLNLCQNPSDHQGGGEFSAMAEELAVKILKSFTGTLSVLKNEGFEVNNHLDPVTFCDDSRSEEGSSESRKRPGVKDKRGCYKRRKNGQTRRVLSASIDDGQAWRKYGQKEILNCKHPRAYFRCTRKYDQGCKATKQVQRLEGNPQLYETLYIGVHTCRDVVIRAPQIIADSDPWKSISVSSDSEIIPKDQQKSPLLHHKHQLVITSTVKKEEEEEEGEEESKEETVLSEISSDNNNNLNNAATSSMEEDVMFWPDLLPLIESPNVGSSVYSCTDTSSHSLELDMDDFVGSVNFDTHFPIL